MPKNISFALTTDQIRDRSKTVTRRINWWVNKKGKRLLLVGDILNGCVKVMGRAPGEPIERLCQIRVTNITREPLIAMQGEYGRSEATKEGFPEMTGPEFAAMFCEHMGTGLHDEVTRIEFEYLNDA